MAYCAAIIWIWRNTLRYSALRCGFAPRAMTAILDLLMYILLFAAAWRLRVKQPELARPFRVPARPLVAVSRA